MVDAGAGPELRLRSGQGQAKGRPAPGRRGGKWGWCTPAARVGTMVKGKSKAQGPGLGARGGAAPVWRGLRHPRMRDKGGTLTLTLHPGRSCGNGPSTQGSVAELGHSGGKYHPHGRRGKTAGNLPETRFVKSPPRARGQNGGTECSKNLRLSPPRAGETGSLSEKLLQM
jgi:hypothetical protein